MKKIMILTASALIFGAATSQAQITIAPEAGINLANWHERDKDPITGKTDKEDGDLKIGVKVGANVNIPIGDHFAIQPGLFYSIRGSKLETESVLGTVKSNSTVHYADIPVNFQYMFNDPDEGRFFIGVGPYLGIAFSGKAKQTGGGLPESTYDYKFGNDAKSNDLERFEFGAQGNAGYLLKSGIFFRAMYQLGITNLIPQAESGNSLKSTNITVSVGYNIGG